MKTRRTRLLLALIVFSGLAASAMASVAFGASADAWRLRAANSSAPPELSFILSTDGPPGQLVVREDGRVVDDYELVPLSKSAGRSGVVLVVDASLSMRGQDEAALDATRAFAARRQERQLVGVLSFNSEVRTVVPLTEDDDRLAEALSKPFELSEGTRLYDALAAAARLLTGAEVEAGSIVLLSDGQDLGSTVGERAALALAKKHNLQIFAVGLRSAGFDEETLRRLAFESGGLYSEAASAAQLDAVYAAVSARLASEYLLSYRSDAAAGRPLRLLVSDAKSQARLTYVVPLAGGEPKTGDSPVLRFSAAFVPALLVFALLFFFLSPRPDGRRAGDALAEGSPAGPEGIDLTAYLYRPDTSRWAKTRWWRALERDLDVARVALERRHVVIAGLALVFLLLLLILTNPLLAPALLVLPLLGWVKLRRRVSLQRRLFADQFPEALQVIASALRAGHGLSSAVQMVTEDCPEPTRGEFLRVIHDERLGVPLDRALRRVAARMENRDLEQAAMAAQLQQRTGGNTAEIFDRVIETVRVRVELKRRVRALTAQGRLARWIVSLMPFGLAGLILVMNPTYLRPLVETNLGRVILVMSFLMLVAGNLIIKRIVEIEA